MMPFKEVLKPPDLLWFQKHILKNLLGPLKNYYQARAYLDKIMATQLYYTEIKIHLSKI